MCRTNPPAVKMAITSFQASQSWTALRILTLRVRATPRDRHCAPVFPPVSQAPFQICASAPWSEPRDQKATAKRKPRRACRGAPGLRPASPCAGTRWAGTSPRQTRPRTRPPRTTPSRRSCHGAIFQQYLRLLEAQPPQVRSPPGHWRSCSIPRGRPNQEPRASRGSPNGASRNAVATGREGRRCQTFFRLLTHELKLIRLHVTGAARPSSY